MCSRELLADNNRAFSSRLVSGIHTVMAWLSAPERSNKANRQRRRSGFAQRWLTDNECFRFTGVWRRRPPPETTGHGSWLGSSPDRRLLTLQIVQFTDSGPRNCSDPSSKKCMFFVNHLAAWTTRLWYGRRRVVKGVSLDLRPDLKKGIFQFPRSIFSSFPPSHSCLGRKGRCWVCAV